MSGEQPWPGLIASSAEGIAEAAVRLYQDQAQWTQAQQAGLGLLQVRYQHSVHCASLIQRIEQLRKDLPAHRTANFIGAMLRMLAYVQDLYGLNDRSRLKPLLRRKALQFR